MAYISYLDLPKHWGLKQGDIVLLTSDIMQLMFTAVRNGERFDRDAFLDAILGVIGQEGTTADSYVQLGFLPWRCLRLP